MLVDRRSHVGGNAFDHHDDAGVLVHKYGPHIFHTQFEGRLRLSVPVHAVAELRASRAGLRGRETGADSDQPRHGQHSARAESRRWTSWKATSSSIAEKRPTIRTSEDVVVSRVGRDLYEKMFRGYTRKQWGLDPSELDACVTARIPVRLNRDDRYFTDTYQAMPLHGFTRMFENMLDHPNIRIVLNTDYRDVLKSVRYRELVYTGPVDEFFDYRFGKLPYRSLKFRHETLNQERLQPVAVINYPNDHEYTRVTEFKHLTGQAHSKTSVVYEYPCDGGDPYYPIPRAGERGPLQTVRGFGGSQSPRCPLRGPPGHVQVLQHGPGGRSGADVVRQAFRRRPVTMSSARARLGASGLTNR